MPTPTESNPCSFEASRLWSLWDMLKLDAHLFVQAINTISHLETLGRQYNDEVYGSGSLAEHMERQLETIITNVQSLGLKQSARKALHLKVSLQDRTPEKAAALAIMFERGVEELRDRIVGELEDRAIYYVEGNKAEFLRLGADPFGEKVADRFCGTSEDISEAVQCIAFSRSTAAVFHLMRVMEVAVKELGETLHCAVIDKHDNGLEWGKIVGNIRAKVEEMPKGDLRDEWSEVVTLLYHVKQAWRNSTMHPKKTYTESEAADVFSAVRAFTQRLSELGPPRPS